MHTLIEISGELEELFSNCFDSVIAGNSNEAPQRFKPYIDKYISTEPRPVDYNICDVVVDYLYDNKVLNKDVTPFWASTVSCA